MKPNKLLTFLMAAAALLVLPLLLQEAGNAWVRILDMSLLYVMLALGLNIVVGYAGLLDLGYVAFFAVGAYLFALLGSPHLAEAFPSIAAAFPNGLHLRHHSGRCRGGRAVWCVAGRADAQAAR
jgi:branched-chain amino acid transport system permease protein